MPFRTLNAGKMDNPASTPDESSISSLSLDGWSPRRDQYIDFYDGAPETNPLALLKQALTKPESKATKSNDIRKPTNIKRADQYDGSVQVSRSSFTSSLDTVDQPDHPEYEVEVQYEQLLSDDDDNDTPSLSQFSLTDSIDDTPLLTPQSLSRALSSEELQAGHRQAGEDDDVDEDQATIRLGTSVHTLRAIPAKPWLTENHADGELDTGRSDSPSPPPPDGDLLAPNKAREQAAARYGWRERRGPQGVLGLKYRELDADESGLDSDEETNFICPYSKEYEVHTVQNGRQVRLDIEQLAADGIKVHDCLTNVVHRPARRGRERERTKRLVRTSPKVKESRTMELAEAMRTPILDRGQSIVPIKPTSTPSKPPKASSFFETLSRWRPTESGTWWTWFDAEAMAFTKRKGKRNYTPRHKPAPSMRVSWQGERPVATLDRERDLLESPR